MVGATLYKHVNNTDIAMEVIKRFYVRQKGIFKCKVCWWNIGRCHKPWCMNIIQNIEIKVEDWKNWQEYEYVDGLYTSFEIKRSVE